MEEQQVQKQHPIPQQVLGIEFKLIGDLTLRQFVILALFGAAAFIAFSLPNVTPLIRVPLAAIIVILGIGFGLVPIQDQPMDRWLGYLVKTIFAPTRRVWEKSPKPPTFLTVPTLKLAPPTEEEISPEEAHQRLEEYLVSVEKKETMGPIDTAEKQRLEFINLELRTAATEAGLPPSPLPPKPVPITRPYPIRRSEEPKKTSLASIINYTAEPVLKLQRGEKITYAPTLRNIKVGRRLHYSPETEIVFAPAKEHVIEPTLPSPPALKEIEAPPAPPKAPPEKEVIPPKEVEAPSPPTPPKPEKPEKKVVSPPPPSKVEEPPPPPEEAAPSPPLPELKPKKAVPKPPAPPPDQPNLITGTIYGAKGTVKGGVIVAVRDQDKTIVSAVKSDQLGQFSFSPLPNGSYQIEFPKAEQSFDIIKLELTGAVVSPLEITAKT